MLSEILVDAATDRVMGVMGVGIFALWTVSTRG